MSTPLNILVLVPSVPNSRGGAELLVERLVGGLNSIGHNAEIFSIPFYPEPKDKLLEQMLIWRAQDLTQVSRRPIDLVIPTKFPTYYVKHHTKVPWLLHQHRQAYELVGTRFGDFSVEDEDIREQIILNDIKMLSECKKIFTISENVSARLEHFLHLDSKVILPPLPSMSSYLTREPQNFILSVGRLCSPKRPDLMIEAMSFFDAGINLKVVGVPDESGYLEYLQSIVKKHHLELRVEFLGAVADEQLRDLYADCHSVYYGPYDEDYGYVIYEASAAKKPIVTLSDSGFPKVQIQKYNTGIISEPNPESIAEAFKRLFNDLDLYQSIRENTLNLRIKDTWEDVATKIIQAIA